MFGHVYLRRGDVLERYCRMIVSCDEFMEAEVAKRRSTLLKEPSEEFPSHTVAHKAKVT